MRELKDYFQLRKNIYILLSKGFYKEPTAEYLAEIEKYIPVFRETASAYGINEFSEGADIYTSFRAKSKSIDAHELTENLAREFALIFLSTGLSEGIKSIVPHESAYLSSLGLTMQDQRDEVLEIYNSNGVGRNDKFKEPEDHISAEMSFMAHMSGKTADEIDNNDKIKKYLKTQDDFINTHILRWIPKVCDDVKKMGSPYYKSLAMFTKGFLLSDKIFVDTLNAELN